MRPVQTESWPLWGYKANNARIRCQNIVRSIDRLQRQLVVKRQEERDATAAAHTAFDRLGTVIQSIDELFRQAREANVRSPEGRPFGIRILDDDGNEIWDQELEELRGERANNDETDE